MRRTIGDALEERLPDARIVVHVVRPTASERAVSDASRTMSHVRSLRSRRALLLACIAAALLGRARGGPGGGPHRRLLLRRGARPAAGSSASAGAGTRSRARTTTDVAYPTIAVIDSGIDDDASGVRRRRRHRPGQRGLPQRPARGRRTATSSACATWARATARSSPGWPPRPPTGVGIVGASPYSTLLVMRIVPEGLGGLACALDYLARQMDRGADRAARGQPLARRPAVAVGRRAAGHRQARAPRRAARGGDGQRRTRTAARAWAIRPACRTCSRSATRRARRSCPARSSTCSPPAAACARRSVGAGLEAHRRRRRRRTRRRSRPARRRRCGARTRTGRR